MPMQIAAPIRLAGDSSGKRAAGLIVLCAALIAAATLSLSAPSLWSWLLQSGGEIVITVGAGIALWLIPGAATLRLLWRESHAQSLTRIERWCLSLCLGIALAPILTVVSYSLGLKLDSTAIRAYVVLAAVLFVALRPANPGLAPHVPATIAGLLALGLSVGLLIRLYLVRELEIGLFGDALQHTVVAQLIMDNGGLFSSWAPYAPITTLSYHFGFQANAAFFSWLTQIDLPRSVVLTGQLLNGVCMPGMFVLTTRLARAASLNFMLANSAGLMAALLTGFVNPMPMYYVNWGRYPQLAAMALLPAAIICVQHAVAVPGPTSRRAMIRTVILAAIGVTGLFLTHYIITALLLSAGVVTILCAAILAGNSSQFRQSIARYLAVIGLAAAASAPWLAQVISGRLNRVSIDVLADAAAHSARIAAYSALPPITPAYLHPTVTGLAILGAALALASKRRALLQPCLWAAIALLFVRPQLIGLPGAGVIDNLTVYISLFALASPLAGFALADIGARATRWLLQDLREGQRAPAMFAVVAAGAACVALTVPNQLLTLDLPRFQLATPADLTAMRWIEQNTARSSRFLVNAFPAYWGSVLAGNDAGWWIPFLAHRDNTLPPLLYDVERGVSDNPEIHARTIGLWQALRARPMTDDRPTGVDLTTDQAYRLLIRHGITHVYSGANSTPRRSQSDYIDTTLLRHDSRYALIYDNGGVEVFAVNR